MTRTDEATVTSKGQVTIPKRVRERLGIDEGETVSFRINDDGTATLQPETDPMEQLREVQDRLAPLSVDVDELRREAKQAWSDFE